MDLDALLARRVRDLRRSRQLTLEQLAERSGVSRSMISLIERQETSPTAAVLNKLAGALGVTLSSLFENDAGEAAVQPLVRHADQPVWTDPASGYQRRQLSPGGMGCPIDLVDVSFPPGAQVAFEGIARAGETHQLVWLLAGEMVITLGARQWHLQAGDCLAMQRDAPIRFHNPGAQPARYALALTTTLPTTARPTPARSPA
jgi:transcriptional regulator with XRE-family HTH domain